MASKPPSPPAAERHVTLAVVTGAHGVQGDVRLKVFAENIEQHRSFNDGALAMTSYRNGIARFAGIGDRNAAEALRGTELTVPRSSLPPLAEGEYYHADLIGLAAVSSDGQPIGTVVNVENYGAGDVIEIERATGKRFMVPMTEQAVPHFDTQQLVVAPNFIED
ncbi:ribosome maturation factor RimM [Sphingomonas baiyangensis]|uniref:Ribosome maturation factor RimM n=1 Tax=Sphingomonas baiyangensis TaxID=2572576 RepID=A0A4U1L1Z8_9SPHN|nr:ribosome maturation factor RimM [Sphingomonas baiyangensis]TKD50881.1 16S rRNA processing protein RimM [Sphingomonas baiyangensis]